MGLCYEDTFVLCITRLCSRTSRTNLQLFDNFANNCSRTRTRDEYCSLLTDSRRTSPKSRSRRNFLFVFVFVVREPYLVSCSLFGLLYIVFFGTILV